jgi:gliding motility-associated lipoprotein GldH
MIPAKLKNKILALIVSVFLISSCQNNDVFFNYKSIPLQGWSKDSVYTFNVVVSDVSKAYNVYINVRNRGEYPHQNLWLFIHKISPDSIVSKDTINFYLADQRGKWLGSGVGASFEMPVIYQRNFHFPKTGKYSFGIVQGMRDSVLIGINDIGLRVEKVNQ